jgi:hypothetical protein
LLGILIFDFFSIKNSFKKYVGPQKKVFARPWSFDFEKSLAFGIHEKYLVKVFDFTLVSLSCFPFQNIGFQKILLVI